MALFTSLMLQIMLLASEPGMPGPAPDLYADPDPAASYLAVPPGRRATYRKMINAAIQKNPRNSVALSHRAHLFIEGGDPVRAKRDFDAALKFAGDDKVYQASVLWSRGWVNYDLGSTDLALDDWRRAENLHGGIPIGSPTPMRWPIGRWAPSHSRCSGSMPPCWPCRSGGETRDSSRSSGIGSRTSRRACAVCSLNGNARIP